MGPLPSGIIAMKPQNDKGNIELALKYAKDAAETENVLAVVGHFESSIMAETLDIYRRSNVPVLMPVPTNPNLTDEFHKTILRMPPNDDDQGNIASNFISSRKNIKHVAVIRDDDNPTYSQYLADKFRAGIDNARTNKMDGPVVVLDETIQKGRLGRAHPDRLRSLKVDAVFFPGTAANANTLLEMFGAAQYKPLILMTDGVLTRSFLLRLSEDPERRLLVTFQLNKTTANAGYPTACIDSFAEFELSFCPYGFDSVILIKQILRTVNAAIALTQRQISRADVLKHFADLRTEREPMRAAFNSYKFDKKGENTLVEFAIWRAEKTRKWSLYPWRTDNGEGP
jgi:branched-chain amino acid transport system substrate-binding protein